ncbi:ABC transporter permease [Flavitalea sp.]|nr:ABC transporter permease [Flavitalea sp.]
MNSTADVTNSDSWDLEITSKSNIFDLHLKDVWNYRDLLLLFVKRDFISVYKQTILGPLWFIIQPLFTTLIYSFIFGRLARIGTNDIPGPLFYLAGAIAWNYFAECLSKTSTVFRDSAGILGKVYFPRLIMPLSIVLSNLIKFGVQFFLFLVIWAWYMFQGQTAGPNMYILLFPVIILLMALQGLGFGLIITALTTKYRDLAFLVAFGMQLAMYATPVIYPLSAVPEKYKQILMLNPLAGLIETFRYGFFDKGEFYSFAFAYSAIVTFVILLIGIFVFNKVERSFVDTI